MLAYVGLFYAASRSIEIIPVALAVLGLTALGLARVNLSSDLQDVLSDGQPVWPYWAQTAAIAAYFLALLALFVKRNATA